MPYLRLSCLSFPSPIIDIVNYLEPTPNFC